MNRRYRKSAVIDSLEFDEFLERAIDEEIFDGAIDEAMLDQSIDSAIADLFTPYPMFNKLVLRRGSRGTAVIELQQRLTQAGFALRADGIFGSNTEAAVRNFQRSRGLGVVGIVGPETWTALLSGSQTPGVVPTTGGRSQSFIEITSSVQTTPEIERALKELEPYFRRENLPVRCTSGYRSPQDQLNLIKRKAIEFGIDQKYPSIRTATLENIESWRPAWDVLLNERKYIINPPVPTSSRITGRQYSASPHSSGKAFDLSGNDLDRIASVVKRYQADGGLIQQVLVERTNNAVHVGLR